MELSKRIGLISPSMTLAISAKAKKMKKEGIDVVGFGAGEPDFDTPEHIKQAAIKAINEGFTKYTPASGSLELKKAVCEKFKKDNGLEYETSEIIISCGAKHSLFNAIASVCNDGDEVIIVSPYWVSYPEMVKAAGATPVIVETDQNSNFKVTVEQLKKVITEKTKLFILNAPSNPTGSMYDKNELKAIADLLLEKNVLCISDEIYEKVVYGGKKAVSIASLGEDIKKKTIVINGVSKAYSMTGWRIGYTAAKPEIIKAMSNLQSHSTSNPTSIAQIAAIEALKGDQECVLVMLKAFDERRKYIVDALNAIDGVSCNNPDGAFYVFASIEKLLGKKSAKGVELKTSLDFCNALLDEENVAAVPGVAFGKDGFLRLSYATSMENIKKGVERLKNFVSKLK